MDELLKTEHLKTYYPVTGGVFKKVKRHIKAVDDVCLGVRAGEIVSVVGESGCGKSTLGNSLLGLVRPASGRIFLAGREIDLASLKSWKPYRKDFQVIFQDPFSSLNPRHTVYEILSEPLLVHGVCSGKEVKTRVSALLEKVGLSPDYRDRYPHAFSGGQRQRLCIARAIGLSPRLIVCDEIVSALDVSVQAQIIQLLLALKKEMGLSLLFIAHDLSLVKAISDRIYVMYLGKIVETAAKRDLFARPRHPYTRSLLESVPTLDRGKKPVILEGEVPSFSNLPGGCYFYSRCANRGAVCLHTIPDLRPCGSSEAACFFPLEEDHAAG
ncbi:ABC transporter ATP-binding protein [Fibrobacterota bacterium]